LEVRGREGTAVQMGGTIADQFTNVFKLDASEGKQFSFLASVLVLLPFWHSISGRFVRIRNIFFSKISFKSIPLSFLTAYIAYFTVEFWNIKHTAYSIPILPDISFTTLFWILTASILLA
jgi:H+/Cl- antiporter ClcA